MISDLIFDLETLEGTYGRNRLLDREIAKARIGTQPVEEPRDLLVRTGERCVKPLARNQRRAFDTSLRTSRLEFRAQPLAVLDGDELVECRDSDRHGFAFAIRASLSSSACLRSTPQR